MIGLFSTAGFSQNNWSLSGNTLGTGNPNDYFLGTTDANPIIFKTNNVEHLRILSNGNTGIGLANPKYSLVLYSPDDSLVGSIHISPLGVGTNGGISFPPPLSPHHVGFTAFQITNYTTGQTKKAGALLYLLGEDFGIKNDSGNIYLTAKNNDVAMSGSNASINATSSGNSSAISVNSSKITTSTDYSYTTADSVLFRVDGDGTAYSFISMKHGRLGINTQYPQATLDVDGNADFRQDISVCGTVNSSNILVQTQTWCDYVFDKNYNLMPLSTLQQYINQNHHLPDVPSASSVKKAGQNVGEMQQKLLKKVEELTLYVIKQQKQINELKAKLK